MNVVNVTALVTSLAGLAYVLWNGWAIRKYSAQAAAARKRTQAALDELALLQQRKRERP